MQKIDLKLPENLNDLDNGTHANDRPLSDWEKFWLSRECFLRYLRANKWNTANAIKGLTKTLVWRREIGLTHGKEDKDPLTADKVAVENETGKQVILGFDNAKRPLYYMKNGRQNTESSFRQVQELVYMMETATTVAPQGVEKIDQREDLISWALLLSTVNLLNTYILLFLRHKFSIYFSYFSFHSIWSGKRTIEGLKFVGKITLFR